MISTDIEKEIQFTNCESDCDDAEENEKRADLINLISNELNVTHPIYYDVYDLCELHKQDKLSGFKVPMLKEICSHFELRLKSKDKKQDLINTITNMLDKCPCCSLPSKLFPAEITSRIISSLQLLSTFGLALVEIFLSFRMRPFFLTKKRHSRLSYIEH